jgi:transcription antitermination factor NusG
MEAGITGHVGVEGTFRMRCGMEKKYEFIAGETVRLQSGVFQLFTGKVVSINKEKERLKVVISALGKMVNR